MIKLNPYAEYKDSGIEWADQIPAGWDVMPLFAIARENSASNKAGTEANLLSLSYGRIVRKDIEGNDGLLPASFNTYQIISRNDIVLRLTDLQNDKRSLRSAISPEQGIITSAYLAVTPTSIAPSYLSYLLRAYDLQKVFYSMGGGLRQSMKFSDMKWLPVTVPPSATQRVIVEYLDRETVQIDDLIGKQERLIELLAEKRQAVITQAVTKGLNPEAPTKPSGIPWLGDIPMHWKLGPVKHFYNIVLGKMLQREQEDETDILRPFLKAASVKSRKLAYSENNQMWFSPTELRNFSLRAGDILVVEGGSIGQSAVIEHDIPSVGFEKSLNRVRPKPGLSSEYFQLYMTMATDSGYVAMQCVGATFMHLTSEKLGRMIMPVPPPREQIEIALHASNTLQQIDRASKRSLKLVALLRERRSALISATVTGKIDVREGGV